MPPVRTIYFAASALTLLLVTLQFLLAGIGVFGAGSFEAHATVGRLLNGTVLLMLLAAVLGRLGRTAVISSAVLFVLVGLQNVLPNAADAIAAFHPLVALVIFVGAAQATQMAARWRSERPAGAAAR